MIIYIRNWWKLKSWYDFLVQWSFCVNNMHTKTASKSIVQVLLTLKLYLTTRIVFSTSFLSTKTYLKLGKGQKNLISRAYSRHSFYVLVEWYLVRRCPIRRIFSHFRKTYLFNHFNILSCVDYCYIIFFLHVTPFHANVPFLYPLKWCQKLWFSDTFRRYRNRTLAWKGLTQW